MTNTSNAGGTPPPAPVWDAQPTGAGQVRYGGFWIRVVAYIIDAIVLNVAFAIIGMFLGVSLIPADPTKLDPEVMSKMGVFELVALVVTWLYFALLESSQRGATVGKMAMGLRVVDEQGNRISFGRATGRFFAKFVSGIILLLGYIMVAFTERKRALHDMMAGTLVIKAR
jgi:uncharacterized RDD family membrane protein YckC